MQLRFLCVLAICISAVSLRADDTVIVTAPGVPLLNADGEAVSQAAFYQVLETTGEDGDYWLVQHDGQVLKIHLGLGYRISELSYATIENSDGIRQAFQRLEKAARAADEGEHEQAIVLTKEASLIAKAKLPAPTALLPWILQYEAWLQCQLENYERAHELLDECDVALQQLNQTRHPHAADVYNTRAIAFDGQRLTEQAIEAYQQALLIALSEVGANHHDTAVIANNLSLTHEAAGNVSQAVFPQQLVLQINQKILPRGNLNVLLAHDRLAALLRDLERWEQALQQYAIVKDLYLQHHSSRQSGLADARSNIIYCKTENEDYAGAEAACEEALQALSETFQADGDHYRKDTLLRMGTIDFRQEQYQEALEHYRAAVAMANPFNYELQDGHAQENIGDVYVQLEDTTKAKAAYKLAIQVYAEAVGADSEEVLILREYTDTLDSDRDESLNGVVQVAVPRGYLLDTDGNVVTTVPGFAVLEWFSSNGEYHEVQYEGKVHRLNNSQLSSKRLLPGYGVTKADTYRAIMADVSASLDALQNQDTQTARLKMQAAVEQCTEQPGTKNSLFLWLKIMQAGVILRTDGTEPALELLAEIESAVEQSNADSFPLMVNFRNVTAAILLEQGDAEEAASQYQQARDIAIQRYGQQHAITLNTMQSLAKALFQADEQQKAIAEFREALQVAQNIFPAGTPEVTGMISDLSIALTQSGNLSDAAELIEGVLEGDHKLPRDVHVMLVATLGKVYAGLDRPADARQLLEAVVGAVNKDGEQAVNSPHGMLAYIELAKLDLAAEQWQQAEQNLRQAVSIISQLELNNTFQASEVHRQLAVALQQQKNFKAAQAQLIEVLRIFDFLGGADSPEAQKIRALQKELATAEMQPHDSPTPTAATPDAFAPVLALIDLTPDRERMLVTKTDARVVAAPQQDAQEISQVSADTKVWSLEARDGFHRISLPDTERFGWIADDAVTDQRSVLVEKGQLFLSEKLSDKPAADLQNCLAAFEAANTARASGNPQAAIPVTEQALATIASHYPRSNALSGLLYQDLLKLYFASRQSMSAEMADEALSSMLSGPGYDHPATAELRVILATKYRTLGNWGKEASELEEVLKICQKRFGKENVRTRGQLLASAANMIRQGFFDQASEIYSDLLASSVTHQTAAEQQAEALIQAAAHLGKGTLDAMIEGHPSANNDLQQAVDQLQKLNFAPPSLIAGALHVLGRSLAQQGEYSKAASLLQQAAAITLPPEDQVIQLSTLTLQSRVAAHDSLEQAVQLATNAMDFAEQVLGADHFLIHDPAQALGSAAARLDPAKAVQAFRKARQLVSSYVQQQVMFQSPAVRISFASADRKSLNEAIGIAFLETGEAAAEETAEWLINGRNLLVDLLAWEKQMMARATTVKDQENLILWQSERSDRADLPLKVQTPALSPSVQTAVQKMQDAEQPYFAQLPGDMKAVPKDRPWATVAQIRQALRPHEVLILFRELSTDTITGNASAAAAPPFDSATTDAGYAAWIIPGNAEEKVQTLVIARRDVVKENIDRTLSVMQDIAGQQSLSSISKAAVQEEQTRLQQLAAVVWKPLQQRLPAGTTHLTICPDGLLHAVPWVALPDAQGAPLIQSFTVRQLLSPLTLLQDSSPYPERNAADSTPLIFSQPEGFGQDPALAEFTENQLQFLNRKTIGTRLPFDKQQLIKATRANSSLVDELLAQAGENARRRNQNAQQDEQSEGEMIADVLGTAFGGKARILEGVSASELQYVQRHSTLLHISAPAFATVPLQVERSSPITSSEARVLIPPKDRALLSPLMNCGLLLAGFNIDEARHHLNDGFLTGEEIVSQDLRGTKLVVLSQAARAVNGSGVQADAVHLLPQAFRQAGAATVVSSVWPMHKDHTDALLKTFYAQLVEGAQPAQALRAAQQKLVEDARRQNTVAPAAVWAGFRVTGEGWTAEQQSETTKTADAPSPVPAATDALSVARQVLAAYGRKDLKQLLSLTADGPPSAETLQEYGPGTSRYNSLFGEQSWRWQAVSAWNRKFSTVYYQKQRQAASEQTADTAHVQFGQNDDEIYVVTLEKVDGSWKFKDIYSPDGKGLNAIPFNVFINRDSC